MHLERIDHVVFTVEDIAAKWPVLMDRINCPRRQNNGEYRREDGSESQAPDEEGWHKAN